MGEGAGWAGGAGCCTAAGGVGRAAAGAAAGGAMGSKRKVMPAGMLARRKGVAKST